jgi:hypothetical protein
MTEEEKRQLALSIMAAEQQRQRSPLAGAQSQLNAALRRSAEQQRVLTSLAQQGITWQQLKMAYALRILNSNPVGTGARARLIYYNNGFTENG